MQSSSTFLRHSRLLLKFEDYIRNSTLSWITDFLSGRTQRILLDGQFCATSPVTSDVPRGTVLGPLLFLVTSMISRVQFVPQV